MSIIENLNLINQEIIDIAKECHRDPSEINLVAVSKRQETDNIRRALEQGHKIFGENQVQEAVSKWADLKQEYPDVTLHMIGHLQSNKAKEAISIFDVIETLDSEKLAKICAKKQKNQNKELDYFIQINTGCEDQKYGIRIEEIKDFFDFCQAEQGLNIKGLMAIPPADDLSSYHFALISKLSKQHGLKQISMGMSNDYKQAITFGSTNIRVGTSIFGTRK